MARPSLCSSPLRRPAGRILTPTRIKATPLRKNHGRGKSEALLLRFSSQHKNQQQYHAGQLKKPLEPYHPNAPRSRLPQPTVVMPYKNSSQIVIGDRSSDSRGQYKTMNSLLMMRPDLHHAVTNGGIIAATNKWIHYNQWKHN